MTTIGLGALTVELSTDAARFAARAAAFLAADPIGTNVVGTWAERAEHGDSPLAATWLLVESADGVLGVAMHTPPFPPYLPPMPAVAAAAVAEGLHRAGTDVSGVNGDAAATAAFVERGTRLTGRSARRVMAEGVHALGTLVPPVGVAGGCRVADAGDVPLLIRWYEAFGNEMGAYRPPTPIEVVRATVARGLMVVWQDPTGRPVSMAGRSRPARGVARIGPVYTPAAQRRRGYAAAATAQASRQALAAGAGTVMLFTDLANPTSNGVYARLGYRRVGEASEWLFEPTG